MTCGVGQTDVNHADMSTIRNSLGLSRPVAERVVAARPYLTPADLIVVPGVGPSKARSIQQSGQACATPTSIPPPSNEACLDDRPDLQSAPASELVSRLGLSAPVADRLVAARPFASISHIVPERVPGLGRGRNDDLRSDACLTPAPVRTSTVSFRWAYASQATTVTRDAAALRVPADVLDGSGAWISIADATSPTPMAGPTSDFHIWGAWSDGSDAVLVTMPLDPDHLSVGDAPLVPALVHEVEGDLELFGGSIATVTTTSVSAWLTNLSAVTSYLLPSPYFTSPDPAGLRGSTVLEELARAFTGTRADQPNCAPPADPARVDTGGTAIRLDPLLGRSPLLWCVGTAGPDARWTFANNTGTVVSINAQHSARVVDTGPSGDLLTDFAFDAFNGTTGQPENTSRVRVDVPPGGTVMVQVPPGVVEDEVAVASNELLAVNAFLLRAFGQFIPADDIAQLWGVLNSCGWEPTVSGLSLVGVLNCVRELGTIPAKKAAEFGLTVVSGVLTLGDALSVETSEPYELLLTWVSLAPPVPSGQGGDGSIGSGSGGSSGPAGRMILKKKNSIESFVLDHGGIAHPIPDGGTYLCNAYVMPVRYGVDAAEFAGAAPGGVGSNATCSNAPARSLSPASTRSYILRLASGEAWLVDTLGRRTRILDGVNGFDCFAERFLVWDQVSQDELRRFSTVPGDVGTFCAGSFS